jgi:RNA polymerase sigma-70 factor (ECF subfamily)
MRRRGAAPEFGTDEALMAAVRGGDLDKLGILFDRRHGALFDFFARVTGDRALSQDLTQEVFFRILKYRRSYRDGGAFTAWMYRIARNVRVDHFRKNPGQEPLPEGAGETLPGGMEASFWERLDETIELERLSDLLERALLQLPPEKRELIVLSRYRQMPHAELAALLEIDLGATRVRVHRALRELETIFLRMLNETGEDALCDARKSANILPGA